MPCSEATIGNALASIGCIAPEPVRISNFACAGRPARIASVVASLSTSTGFPSLLNGPKAFVH